MSLILNIIFSFIIGVLLVILKYEYDKRAKLEERLFKDKASLYGTFLEKLSGVIIKKRKIDKASKDLIEYMGKFKFMLMLFGSDEVYKTFLEVSEATVQKNITPRLMGKLFMALRKDIVKETQLTQKELLRGIVTDIEKYDDNLNKKVPNVTSVFNSR